MTTGGSSLNNLLDTALDLRRALREAFPVSPISWDDLRRRSVNVAAVKSGKRVFS